MASSGEAEGAAMAAEVAKMRKEEEEEEAHSPVGRDRGVSFFDNLFGGSSDGESEAVKKLEEQLERVREEMIDKEGELEQRNGDREYYEGQLADMRSELSQKDRKLEDVKADLENITSGAARKQQERALKDAEKTVSYCRKHLFHLFKATGQERVREYTKEVFAGNWKVDPPGVLPTGGGSGGAEKLGRELEALEKRFKKLQGEALERDEEIKARDKEVRYLEETLEKEKARANRAEALLLSTASSNNQREKTKKKTSMYSWMTGRK